LALYDEYPNTAVSDQVSLDEPASDQASLEPWDEWQSWDDTDTYEDPGIPTMEMIHWQNTELERRAKEIEARTSFEDDTVISPQASDDDFPLPHLSPSQTAHDSDEYSDHNADDEDDAPKRRGPKRNATFPDPPHGALPHPTLGVELDLATMQEYMTNYARQEGSAYTRTNYNHGTTIRWRCKHNGKYNNHRNLPKQVTNKERQTRSY
jgi:hypothetical protein